LPPEPYGSIVVAAQNMNPPLTDAELLQIGGLPGVGRVNLRGDSITDARVDCLAKLPLTGIELTRPVPIEALERVARLTKLDALRMVNNRDINDAHVAVVSRMTNLRTLDMNDMNKGGITDAGLTRLESLKSLKRLRIRNTRVTAEGVARLQKALPKLKIEWEGAPGSPDDASPADFDDAPNAK